MSFFELPFGRNHHSSIKPIMTLFGKTYRIEASRWPWRDYFISDSPSRAETSFGLFSNTLLNITWASRNFPSL